jgi:hypothetical protein
MDCAIEHGESNLQVLFGNRLWNCMPSKNKRNGDLVYNGHYWFTTFALCRLFAAGGIGFTIFGNKYYLEACENH